MTKQSTWLVWLVLSVTLTQCSQCKENVTPFVGLPPETQTGAGTFACLINGEVWTYKDPKSSLSLKEVTDWSFDPNEFGGRLTISALRYDEKDIGIDQMGFFADSLIFKREIVLNNTNPRSMGFAYTPYKVEFPKCDYATNDTLAKDFFRQGSLTVTKFDTQQKIISGRFNYTIYRFGCDTLRITQGRFDIKYK